MRDVADSVLDREDPQDTLRLWLCSGLVKNDSSREGVVLTTLASIVFFPLGARLCGRTRRMPSGCVYAPVWSRTTCQEGTLYSPLPRLPFPFA